MTPDQLKSLYVLLLIKYGVSTCKAEEASKQLSLKELNIISDIWPEWNNVYINLEIDL